MSKSSIVRQLLFVVWMLAVGFISLLLAFAMGAAVYRHISTGGHKLPHFLQPLVETLAEAPGIVMQAAIELRDEVTGSPSALLIPRDKIKQADWEHKFPAPEDDGYLLLSGLSSEERQTIVQLIRIADGQVIAKWIPDWGDIHRQISSHRLAPRGNPKTYSAFHPLLLDDGSIIFNTLSSLVRLPLCSSKPSWVLSYPYHHSIELSPQGNSVWVPSVTETFATDNLLLKEKLIDNSLAEVSLDGRVIQNLSFSKILAQNNMTAHMLGTSGFTVNLDPIHINQITPATSDSPYWQRNDLLISARHTSTVYIYRPSTGKIIWHQQGPWLNQHSAHFLNENTIVIFGNDVYGNFPKSPFIYKEGHNQIYQYDFKTGHTQQLRSESLNAIKPRTVTGGRVRVLEDTSIFIEEINNARLFKINPSGELAWSYINIYDANNFGAISWSRYIANKDFNNKINAEIVRCVKN
jgi:outer membrane protein assembly factor BamB